MKEKIKQLIEEKHKSSGGNCGLIAPKIVNFLGITWTDFNVCIKVLIEEEVVEERDGGQGILYMLKTKK